MATASRTDPGADTLAESTPAETPKTGSDRPRGSMIGRYVIVEPLGKGGMGAVYAAYDTQLDRRVALKLLRAARGEEPEEWRARLLREAQAMARLSHPNVVTVYDVGVAEDGQVFLSMEIVDGGTLTEWLKAKKRSWQEILRVCCEAGEGLAIAHSAGIVHRDFKLENILMGVDGRTRVTDFGVASVAFVGAGPAVAKRAADEGSATGLEWESPSSSFARPLTLTGAMLGTPGFMAPEQYDSAGDIDARADIFAFCATLYRAIYGERPFGGTSVHQIATATFKGEVRPAPKDSDVPIWLRRVLLQGLAVDPQARPASMQELLAALRANLFDRPRRRRRWILAALGLAACALGGAAWARHDASLRAACARGSALVASSWNPTVDRRVREALRRGGSRYTTDLADRVAQRFSHFAETWASTYRTVAEATLLRGEQSAGDMERRMQCLERGRQQLEALADVLAQSDTAVAQRAIDAVSRLPPPALCATSDIARVPQRPPSPEVRERVLEIELALARGYALSNAGQDEKVEALVEKTLPDVRAIHYPNAEAELLLIQGRSKLGMGDNAAALSTYEDALRAAERAADDALAARSASMISFVLSAYLERPQEADRWFRLARAKAERVGRDDVLDAQVNASQISIATMLGQPEKAVELQEAHVALIEKVYGEADPRFAMAIMNRSVAGNRAGRSDRSLADAERAIELLVAATGSENPHLDLFYITLATPLAALDRQKEAKAAFQHALDIQAGRRPGGLTICALDGIASIEESTGDLDAALATATRGLEVAKDIGADEAFRWSLMITRARVLGRKGDLKAQHEGCRQALAAQKAQGAVAADRVYEPDALRCLGDAALAMNHAAAAIDYLEQSLALDRRGDVIGLPLVRFALARALVAAGRDPVRARTLAESARAALAKVVGHHQDLAEVEQWLRQHE